MNETKDAGIVDYCNATAAAKKRIPRKKKYISNKHPQKKTKRAVQQSVKSGFLSSASVQKWSRIRLSFDHEN